jgi:hypothetical protein
MTDGVAIASSEAAPKPAEMSLCTAARPDVGEEKVVRCGSTTKTPKTTHPPPSQERKRLRKKTYLQEVHFEHSLHVNVC